jgi:hypothetical protein
VLVICFSFLCCVLFSFVCLCIVSSVNCQFLWIIYSWLPLRFSLTFIYIDNLSYQYGICSMLSTGHHFVIIGEWPTIKVRTVSFILTILFYTGIECVWCFTINIYGETCIEAGVPYLITCNVKQVKVNRITNFNARISDTDQLGFIIRHYRIWMFLSVW